MSAPLFITTDNAMGARSGDVDDGLALMHLIARRAPILTVASTYGNAGEAEVHANCAELIARFKLDSVRLVRGPSRRLACPNTFVEELEKFLRAEMQANCRILELGPLTGLADVLKRFSGRRPENLEYVGIVGTTLKTLGRWPPVWPFEFNLTHDREATQKVFTSDWPLLVLPLDVASRFRFQLNELRLADAFSQAWLEQKVARWFYRTKRLYFRNSVIIWDAVLALFTTHPELFRVESRRIKLTKRGAVYYASEGRELRVIVDFDVAACRSVFLESLRSLRVSPAPGDAG